MIQSSAWLDPVFMYQSLAWFKEWLGSYVDSIIICKPAIYKINQKIPKKRRFWLKTGDFLGKAKVNCI